jgi:hypothetical protein
MTAVPASIAAHPHDIPAADTQFRGLTGCQGLGVLEYNFLAAFAAAEHTVWRHGVSDQEKLS